MYCDNVCRSKQLGIDGKGQGNYFYGKKILPWNKGNRIERYVTNPKKSYSKVYYWDGAKYKFVYEHREIVENHLGRKLNPKELVHHMDGDIKNNNLSNLMVVSHAEHSRIHAKRN